MIICAGKSEQFDFAMPVGVGMMEVAINLTRLCEARKADYILFVGTAGSYGKKKIFDIIESKTAANIENSFFTGGSYSPLDNVVTGLSKEEMYKLQPSNVSRETNKSREIIVNSSNYITTDKKMGPYYTAQNVHIENMEFFAVMKVAQFYKISAGGIFCITNYCDENAHEDFEKNQKEAMKRLDAYVKERARK